MGLIPPRGRRVLDNALDALVVPGFSRIGFAVRSAQFRPLSSYSLEGKCVVVTGPTSGLGRAAVEQIAAMKARVVLVGRTVEKLERVRTELMGKGAQVDLVECDMGNLVAVASAAQQIVGLSSSVHALVHNAGSLLESRTTSVQGHEMTVATHVLGPHLMTTLLLPVLRNSGRVIMVSSGGMYAAVLPTVESEGCPEMSAASYDGTRQYALAKRAQVTLNEMWPLREPAVDFACMHPGWADTPGVREALPVFRAMTRPLLRSPEQGADTISWLVADDAVCQRNGRFWCDREERPIHRLARTRTADTPVRRDALWKWCDTAVAPFLT